MKWGGNDKQFLPVQTLVLSQKAAVISIYSSPYSIPMNFSMTIDFVLQIITEYHFIPMNKKEEFRLLLNHNLVKIVSQKNVNPVLL